MKFEAEIIDMFIDFTYIYLLLQQRFPQSSETESRAPRKPRSWYDTILVIAILPTKTQATELHVLCQMNEELHERVELARELA